MIKYFHFLTEIPMEHYLKLIKGMVSNDSTKRLPFKEIIQQITNNASYSEIRKNDVVVKVRDKVKLGSGGYGDVFYGTYSSKEVPQKRSVAIKKIDLDKSDKREESALQKLSHPNVIQLFHETVDQNFRYELKSHN